MPFLVFNQIRKKGSSYSILLGGDAYAELKLVSSPAGGEGQVIRLQGFDTLN